MILIILQFYERNGMEKNARPYREEYKRYKLPSSMKPVMVNGVMYLLSELE